MLDSMRNLGWFRRRRYGFGFTPDSPAGWLLTIVLLAAIWGSHYLVRHDHSAFPAWYVIGCIAAILLYAAIACLTVKRDP